MFEALGVIFEAVEDTFGVPGLTFGVLGGNFWSLGGALGFIFGRVWAHLLSLWRQDGKQMPTRRPFERDSA